MSKPTRVLIVEDSPIILENLTELLEELGGIEIVGTATAQEAGKWMDGHTQACDVALIDNFDSGSGLAVLKHAYSYRFPPERVVLTNYATREMRQVCEKLGAAAVFDRSTEIDELIEWLKTRSVSDEG